MCVSLCACLRVCVCLPVSACVCVCPCVCVCVAGLGISLTRVYVFPPPRPPPPPSYSGLQTPYYPLPGHRGLLTAIGIMLQYDTEMGSSQDYDYEGGAATSFAARQAHRRHRPERYSRHAGHERYSRLSSTTRSSSFAGDSVSSVLVLDAGLTAAAAAAQAPNSLSLPTSAISSARSSPRQSFDISHRDSTHMTTAAAAFAHARPESARISERLGGPPPPPRPLGFGATHTLAAALAGAQMCLAGGGVPLAHVPKSSSAPLSKVAQAHFGFGAHPDAGFGAQPGDMMVAWVGPPPPDHGSASASGSGVGTAPLLADARAVGPWGGEEEEGEEEAGHALMAPRVALAVERVALALLSLSCRLGWVELAGTALRALLNQGHSFELVSCWEGHTLCAVLVASSAVAAVVARAAVLVLLMSTCPFL